MKRLEITLKSGAVIQADVLDSYKMTKSGGELTAMTWGHPKGVRTEPRRLLQHLVIGDVVAIVEVRP